MRNPFSKQVPEQAAAAKPDDPNPITELAIKPQTDLDKYLAYYVGRLKPGYAVLVTGDWGTGKSYQVRRALPDTHSHYISLFGLNTPGEIEAQVFAKMFPRASKLKRFAEQADDTSIDIPVLGSLGTGGLASLLVGTFIKNEVDSSRPIILDDLERCTVDNVVLLGMINRYVEHHGCRVIVIAHDDKIVKTFAETKEKVFGQTLHVDPDVEAAFAEFLKVFSDLKGLGRLGEHRQEVLATFTESGTASLRILRHVVEDAGRLAAALEDRHFANGMAMVELIRLFTALSVETRTNRLKREDLFQRKEKIFAHRMEMGRGKQDPPPKSRIFDAMKRYGSIDIAGTLLNDNVLAEMLFDGRFVPEHILASLDNSAYFLENEVAPPWQVVGSFDKLNDVDVDAALKRMNEQFDNREVTESGELLHIVSLRMMMASRGILNKTTADVAAEAKAYIDDLLKAKRLPPRKSGYMWADDFKQAFDGVAYWIVDSYRLDFQSVFDHLINARTTASYLALPGQVPALLDVVKTDGQKFFDKVCHTRDKVLEFEDIPILAFVDPVEFVDAWLISPKTGWYWIGSALKERGKMVSHYPALAIEDAWYPKVHAEMRKRAMGQSGLARVRMERAAEMLGIVKPAHPPAPAAVTPKVSAKPAAPTKPRTAAAARVPRKKAE
ncbi:P-loop NTPase fold protein [Rhizobium laguerreae]